MTFSPIVADFAVRVERALMDMLRHDRAANGAFIANVTDGKSSTAEIAARASSSFGEAVSAVLTAGCSCDAADSECAKAAVFLMLLLGQKMDAFDRQPEVPRV